MKVKKLKANTFTTKTSDIFSSILAVAASKASQTYVVKQVRL